MLTWDDIGVSIRAVPDKRQHLLDRLRGQLSGFGIPFKVSYHGEGRSLHESYADAWNSWKGSGKTWVLQFEDDAYLCPNFGQLALKVITEAAVARIFFVSLYSGRRVKDGEKLPEPGSWEKLPGARFLMAQAIAMQSSLIASHNAYMLDYAKVRPHTTDTATGAWLGKNRLAMARAWPSLIQHEDGGESLYGHKAHPNRRSQSFKATFPTLRRIDPLNRIAAG